MLSQGEISAGLKQSVQSALTDKNKNKVLFDLLEGVQGHLASPVWFVVFLEGSAGQRFPGAAAGGLAA